jgi:transcriptional regulator of acetoin/glycerol metabolism
MEHAHRVAVPGHSLPSYAIGQHLAGGEDISRSWQRCRQAGLAPERSRIDGPHYSATELRSANERRATLIMQSRPVIDYIYGQIRDSGCLLLLSDENGFLLDSLGDADFCGRAAQVALKPGACWAEDSRGTNAIGTALVEAKPIVVNGTEHYLRHNGFLSCAAAPLVEPSGKLLGVIDISCDARAYHPHTFGLVRAAAQMIENRIFEITFRAATKLRFHISSACLGSVMEGALALSDDGRLLGANHAGFDLLHLKPADIGRLTLPELFGLKLSTLLDQDRHAQGRPLPITLPKHGKIFVTIDQFRLPSFRTNEPAPAPAKPDRLGALDIGDERIKKAIVQIRRVLEKPVPILLQGETGTGKDFFARAIHAAGPRAAQNFVAVNCAALPETLIESELFGHSPGAFTGARREGALGRIREAHGGTLFLDEIGDMPVQMQTRLLQVLETREVTPLGGGKPQKVDFQLISATHCDLAARIATMQFRADLFYRLNGLAIQLPPLRDRTDFSALASALLATEAASRAPITLSPDLAKTFESYFWPGNIRQLASMLRTACMMLDESETVLDWPHLSETARAELLAKPPLPATPVTGSLRAHSDAVIAQTLAAANGNIAAAARKLRISRNTLYRRLNAGS